MLYCIEAAVRGSSGLQAFRILIEVNRTFACVKPAGLDPLFFKIFTVLHVKFFCHCGSLVHGNHCSNISKVIQMPISLFISKGLRVVSYNWWYSFRKPYWVVVKCKVPGLSSLISFVESLRLCIIQGLLAEAFRKMGLHQTFLFSVRDCKRIAEKGSKIFAFNNHHFPSPILI